MSTTTITTDEEKSRLIKLLEGLDTPEVRLTERCNELVKIFHEKFSKEVEEEMNQMPYPVTEYDNPYKVNKALLEQNEQKMKQLMEDTRRKIKKIRQDNSILTNSSSDPKRPWRTHSCKEQLLRIDHEIRRHHEKSSDLITPMSENDILKLIKECKEEAEFAPTVAEDSINDAVDGAVKDLPNFQYKTISNSTATCIFPKAHPEILEEVKEAPEMPGLNNFE